MSPLPPTHSAAHHVDLSHGRHLEYVDRRPETPHTAGADDGRHPSIFEAYSVNTALGSAGHAADDDLMLVAAMARGEERAATALYDRHGAVMYGLSLRMVGEPADAEEVVLDAFAQAWREAARYDTSRGSVLGWLTTIVRTRALDAIRARGRRAKMVETATVVLDAPAAMSEGPAAPDRAVEERERARAVGSALRSLPDAQRRAIELAFFEGLTHQEVAERLAEPLGTVKTRIRLGMLKLRDMLGGLAPEPAA